MGRYKFVENRFYLALVSSFMAILPFTLISAALGGIVALSYEFAVDNSILNWLSALQLTVNMALPILLNAIFALSWAMKARMPMWQTMVISVFSLFLIHGLLNPDAHFLLNISIPMSLGTAALSCWVQGLITTACTNLMRKQSFSAHGAVTLNIVQALLCFIFSTSLVVMLFYPLSTMELFSKDLIHDIFYPKDIWHTMLYELGKSVSWFFGFHGDYMLGDVLEKFSLVTAQNLSDVNLGKTSDVLIINSVFINTWCTIGGSGSTFSLLICMLILWRKTHGGLLGTALPLGLFNINEPVIFGVPVILNPLMLIPFLLTPIVGLVLAYLATIWQLVPPMTVTTPWITPPLLNAWLGSDGSWAAVLLQAFIIALGVLIYYPFLRNMGRVTASLALNADRSTLVAEQNPYHQHLTEFSANQRAHQRITELRTAGEFILFFQPQVHLESNKITGLEVLIRHKGHDGKISPPSFIQHYEKLGLMAELDFWVLEHAIEHLRHSLKTLGDGMVLSVNISPQTLIDARLPLVLARVLKEPLPHGWTLEFEITEATQLSDHRLVYDILTKLQQQGINISLDDFGSGYSTLSYLTLYPLNKIKLDRTLVLGLKSAHGIDFFNQVVSLCKTTQSQVLVEGVETEDELFHVRKAGADYVQGYYFYRPISLDETVTLLKKQQEDCSS